jgi:hypothetical protein
MTSRLGWSGVMVCAAGPDIRISTGRHTPSIDCLLVDTKPDAKPANPATAATPMIVFAIRHM